MKKLLLLGSIAVLMVSFGACKKKAINPALNEPLLKACENGDLAQVKKLLGDGADPNAKGSFGSTPILKAYKSAEVVKVLLDNDANINAQDDQKWTVLSMSIFNGVYDTAKVLIDKKADVNIKNEIDWTPLMYAVSRLKYDDEAVAKNCIKSLLAKGADTKAKNKDGKTALDILKANGTGNPELEKLLQ